LPSRCRVTGKFCEKTFDLFSGAHVYDAGKVKFGSNDRCGHRWLLPPRRERARRRAAEQGDEGAAPHVCSPLNPRIAPYHTIPGNAALCITTKSRPQ
jgi:hypothetical protein